MQIVQRNKVKRAVKGIMLDHNRINIIKPTKKKSKFIVEFQKLIYDNADNMLEVENTLAWSIGAHAIQD